MVLLCMRHYIKCLTLSSLSKCNDLQFIWNDFIFGWNQAELSFLFFNPFPINHFIGSPSISKSPILHFFSSSMLFNSKYITLWKVNWMQMTCVIIVWCIMHENVMLVLGLTKPLCDTTAMSLNQKLRWLHIEPWGTQLKS